MNAHNTERSAAHQLKYIGGEYRVLHGKRLGGGKLDIDHLVIGPNGLFHIDTKHWDGEIQLGAGGEGQLQTAETAAGLDPTAQLYRQEHALKELLRQHKLRADVVGIVCFTHPDATLIGTSAAFNAVKVERLVQQIKSHRPSRTLSASEVAEMERILVHSSK
ncbi:nuclease-related domain-containing protein [Paenibacillus sp. YYML68]|uniref:nuclease-related domain-containing protein n=1 Tax=Paenibacillus sp. YYML68 TaxID=2909250 RepID=UPI00248FFF6D|nr:nuclease-related domain-containing protein [Paenibacillus sp. YYML68]